jgi:long-chain acyl-CoA synthetase
MAFIQLKVGRDVTVEDLHGHAEEHLASYKRPRDIAIVSELPRNLTGKVLKGELRAPFWKNRERNI